MTSPSSFLFALFAFIMIASLNDDDHRREHREPATVVPRRNPALLEELRTYCQRYGKEPYITRCVEDRAARNGVAAQ